MADIAQLQVVVSADTAGAERGLAGLQERVGGLQSAFAGGLGIAAGIGALSAAVGAVKGAFDGLVGSGVGLNVSMENVRAQLNAFTKDGAVSAQILAGIRAEADKTPFAFDELARATAGLMPAARQAQVPLMDLVKTAEILAASNPAEGLEGAAFALREAVSGDFTSVIERFNLPRQYINQLKAEGVPALEAVRKAMLAMGYDADLVANLAGTLSGRWSTFQDTIAGLQQKLTEPIFEGLRSGLEAVQGWFDRNKDTIDVWVSAVKSGVTGAVDTIGGMLSSLGDLFGRVFERLSAGDVSGAVSVVTDAVAAALQGALATVSAFGESMFGAGWKLMESLAGGIVQGASSAIQTAINVVADLIASFFIGASPPPAGPLSRIAEGGKTLMETYGAGMRDGLAPIEAAVKAVSDQFDNATLAGGLKGMNEEFEAARGNLEAMKGLGQDTEAWIKAIDTEMRQLERSSNAVKAVADAIKDSFEDQIRPLEQQLRLLRGAHDFGRDEKDIAFEERDLAIRRQEIAARGNKEAEKAVRARRDAFRVEKDLYDIQNRQNDLARKRTEIPILQQIDALKTAQEDATAPLRDQIRLLDQQKRQLGEQKTAWTDFSATIKDAVAAATPKGGGGGGGVKAPTGGLGGKLDLGASIDKGIGDLQFKMLARGQELAAKLTEGVAGFFREKAPALVGAAAGALFGGLVGGPLGVLAGAALGAKVGEGLTRALAERGVDWEQIMGPLRQGAERVQTLLRSIFSGDTLATGVNKAFGDLIPADLNAKLDAADAAVQKLKASVAELATNLRELAATTASGGLPGFFEQMAVQMERAGGPQSAGALRDGVTEVGTAMQTAASVGSGILAFFARMAEQMGIVGAVASTTRNDVDAAMAAILASALKPVEGFNTLAAGVEAVAERFKTALAGMDGSLATFSTTSGQTIDGWVAASATKFGEWSTAALAAFEGMRQGATDKFGEITDALGRFADDFGSVLSALAGDVLKQAQAIGQAMIDGIGGALDRGFAALKQKATDWANSLPKWVRDALGIASPSRVFVEIGEQIVAGLAAGLQSNLGAIDVAFTRMTQLFRDAAQSAKKPIDDLIGYLVRGGSPQGKDISGGYIAEFLKHVNAETAQAMGDNIRKYFGEYLDTLGTLADDALPAVARVREDLAEGLGQAVADATRDASQAVDAAAEQIADAVAGLADNRALRARRQAQAAGSSSQDRARSAEREDAEADYQYRRQLRLSEADTVKRLQAARTDKERDAIKAEAKERLAQLNAQFAEQAEERAHRRQLAEEDRLYEEEQARALQAFEDGLADEQLAKNIARIETEKNARLDAIRAEMALRQQAEVQRAQKALQRIVDDVNAAINDSIGKVFDAIAKAGGPTDPGFLKRLREDISAIIVPIAGMIQSLLANLAGIPNAYGPGVTYPVGPGAPTYTGGTGGIPPASTTPAPAAPVTIVVNAASLHGSVADLARVLQPELARLSR